MQIGLELVIKLLLYGPCDVRCEVRGQEGCDQVINLLETPIRIWHII